MNVNTQNEDNLLEKAKFISGDFLNSIPGAMEMFVPELAAEIEEKIKADQESDHPSPDKCINISITPEQLVRLVNGIKEAKRKKR